MEPRDWIAAFGILVAGTVPLFALTMNLKRDRERQERDDRVHKEQLAREDDIRHKTGLLVPHMEFHLEGNFFGPVHDDYIGEFVLRLINRGSVAHPIRSLTLTLRGLEGNTPLNFWDRSPRFVRSRRVPCRVNFAANFLDEAEVILPDESINVDPGVALDMPLATKIPQDYRYILAKANFNYDEHSRYGVEKIFEVRAGEVRG